MNFIVTDSTLLKRLLERVICYTLQDDVIPALSEASRDISYLAYSPSVSSLATGSGAGAVSAASPFSSRLIPSLVELFKTFRTQQGDPGPGLRSLPSVNASLVKDYENILTVLAQLEQTISDLMNEDRAQGKVPQVRPAFFEQVGLNLLVSSALQVLGSSTSYANLRGVDSAGLSLRHTHVAVHQSAFPGTGIDHTGLAMVGSHTLKLSATSSAVLSRASDLDPLKPRSARYPAFDMYIPSADLPVNTPSVAAALGLLLRGAGSFQGSNVLDALYQYFTDMGILLNYEYLMSVGTLYAAADPQYDTSNRDLNLVFAETSRTKKLAADRIFIRNQAAVALLQCFIHEFLPVEVRAEVMPYMQGNDAIDFDDQINWIMSLPVAKPTLDIMGPISVITKARRAGQVHTVFNAGQNNGSSGTPGSWVATQRMLDLISVSHAILSIRRMHQFWAAYEEGAARIPSGKLRLMTSSVSMDECPTAITSFNSYEGAAIKSIDDLDLTRFLGWGLTASNGSISTLLQGSATVDSSLLIPVYYGFVDFPTYVDEYTKALTKLGAATGLQSKLVLGTSLQSLNFPVIPIRQLVSRLDMEALRILHDPASTTYVPAEALPYPAASTIPVIDQALISTSKKVVGTYQIVRDQLPFIFLRPGAMLESLPSGGDFLSSLVKIEPQDIAMARTRLATILGVDDKSLAGLAALAQVGYNVGFLASKSADVFSIAIAANSWHTDASLRCYYVPVPKYMNKVYLVHSVPETTVVTTGSSPELGSVATYVSALAFTDTVLELSLAADISGFMVRSASLARATGVAPTITASAIIPSPVAALPSGTSYSIQPSLR